jgi:hypothetical protein
MAIEFAKRGADLVLVSRSEEKLKAALKNVEVLPVCLSHILIYLGGSCIAGADLHVSQCRFVKSRRSKKGNHFL